jgi:hypothetical protein
VLLIVVREGKKHAVCHTSTKLHSRLVAVRGEMLNRLVSARGVVRAENGVV